MSTLAFWTVAVLTAAKTGVIPVRKPFEWVGELATGHPTDTLIVGGLGGPTRKAQR